MQLLRLFWFGPLLCLLFFQTDHLSESLGAKPAVVDLLFEGCPDKTGWGGHILECFLKPFTIPPNLHANNSAAAQGRMDINPYLPALVRIQPLTVLVITVISARLFVVTLEEWGIPPDHQSLDDC